MKFNPPTSHPTPNIIMVSTNILYIQIHIISTLLLVTGRDTRHGIYLLLLFYFIYFFILFMIFFLWFFFLCFYFLWFSYLYITYYIRPWKSKHVYTKTGTIRKLPSGTGSHSSLIIKCTFFLLFFYFSSFFFTLFFLHFLKILIINILS